MKNSKILIKTLYAHIEYLEKKLYKNQISDEVCGISDEIKNPYIDAIYIPPTKEFKKNQKKAEESVDELQDFHINKKSSGKAQPNYTASELRAELISIFKKYDAYDEDPTSILYENIISILKEKGFSGLRDCLMKDFNREKREKILRDISESSILRTLWSLKIQKSPIKALLV